MQKKILSLFIFFSLVLTAPLFAETITLKSGKVINAKIIERATNYIKVDFHSVPVTYYKDEIESIGVDLIPTITAPAQHPTADGIAHLIRDVSRSVVIIEAKNANSRTEGTGFFISDTGLVVTNFHVVFKASDISVRTQNGGSYPAEFVVNSNEDLDICVLKINAENTPALKISDSDNLKSGDIIFTIGHREGSHYQTSSGPYIGKRMIDGEENLQTKMVTGHGNSGGPILNKNGALVGISKAFSPETGHNFGIPINVAKPFLTYHEPITVRDFNERINPAHALTYNGQGALLAGKYAEALQYFKQALVMEPENFKAHLGSAKAYSLMNLTSEAAREWQTVLKLDPNNVQAHLRLGKDSLNSGNIDQSIVHLEKVAILAPETHEVYRDLGFAYGKNGMIAQAVTAYNKAVELDPKDGESHFNLAAAYFNQRDFDHANEFADKARALGYAVPEAFLSQLQETKKYGNLFKLK